jgi:hypothetical protein
MLRQRAAAAGDQDCTGGESQEMRRSHGVFQLVIKGNYFAMLRPACQPESPRQTAFLREIGNVISV